MEHRLPHCILTVINIRIFSTSLPHPSRAINTRHVPGKADELLIPFHIHTFAKRELRESRPLMPSFTNQLMPCVYFITGMKSSLLDSNFLSTVQIQKRSGVVRGGCFLFLRMLRAGSKFRTSIVSTRMATIRTLSNSTTGIVDKEQLKVLLKDDAIDLIDVREPDEFREGAIPDARNVPLSQLPTTLSSSDSTKRQLGLPVDKSTPIVVYCRSGKRATQAQQLLQANGYQNVQNYIGSWLDWIKQ
jgi:rhodanese-related sulfurtransferase